MQDNKNETNRVDEAALRERIAEEPPTDYAPPPGESSRPQQQKERNLSDQKTPPKRAGKTSTNKQAREISRELQNSFAPTLGRLEELVHLHEPEFKKILTRQSIILEKMTKRQNRAGLSDLKTSSVMILSLIATFLVAASIVLGAFTQERLTFFDRTSGWKTYIWVRHGAQIRDCKRQAQKENTALKCNIIEKP